MSVEASRTVWEHSTQKGEALLVLLAIADQADTTGRNAYPSAEKLARKARIHRQSVWRIIERLKAAGELAIDRKGGGRGRSNHYRITLPMGEKNSHLAYTVETLDSQNSHPAETIWPDNSHSAETVTIAENSHPESKTVTLDPQNSHPGYTGSILDPSIRSIRKRSKRTAEDPNASFWDMKPASPEGTANAVQTHARIKSKKKLNAIPSGVQALSPSISQGSSQRSDSHADNQALNVWIKQTLLSAYPRHRLSNVAGAYRFLRQNQPDQAAREAIMARLDKWRSCDEWTRDGGQYVPDIAKFLSALKYQGDPPDYRPSVTESRPSKERIWH